MATTIGDKNHRLIASTKTGAESMSNISNLRPALPILVGAALMLSISLGLKQSLGIFMLPLTRDIDISASDFTLAIAVQNIVWGFLQPFAGAWALRLGFRRLMLGGSLLYVFGLVLLATSRGIIGITLGAGVFIGISMACTGVAIALAVAGRAVSVAVRSTVFGLVSGMGSLGAMLLAPIGQAMSQTYGWRAAILGFSAIALALGPAAWFAGRVDRLPMPPSPVSSDGRGDNASAAIARALRNPSFVVMTIAYIICGMQLVFLTTHLPTYISICGLDPMLSAQALGAIGAFNIIGSIFFGWAGGRTNKHLLLGSIYILRSLGIAWYFMSIPTPTNTIVFAAAMGFLWFGVAPLVDGWIGQTFGLRWQAMLGGVAFMSHQVGSFIGAFGGGVIYDFSGSYATAWRLAVVLGLVSGVIQAAFAIARPPTPPLVTAG